jgi:hypothetical protein
MDVRPFAARAIDTYAGPRQHHGDDAARRSAVLSAAENAAAAHGVHHARASRVVEFALERYAAHRSKGAGHGSSRDAASDAGRCCPFTGRWPIRLGAAGRYSGVSCRFRLAPRQPRPVGGSFLTRAPLFPGESARKLAGRQPSTLGPHGPQDAPATGRLFADEIGSVRQVVEQQPVVDLVAEDRPALFRCSRLTIR